VRRPITYSCASPGLSRVCQVGDMDSKRHWTPGSPAARLNGQALATSLGSTSKRLVMCTRSTLVVWPSNLTTTIEFKGEDDNAISTQFLESTLLKVNKSFHAFCLHDQMETEKSPNHMSFDKSFALRFREYRAKYSYGWGDSWFH
jgi:hypothetical protein